MCYHNSILLYCIGTYPAPYHALVCVALYYMFIKSSRSFVEVMLLDVPVGLVQHYIGKLTYLYVEEL